MGIFSTTELSSMEDLLVNQLDDLYDAEKRLTDALPKMAEAASSGSCECFHHPLTTDERSYRPLGRSISKTWPYARQ